MVPVLDERENMNTEIFEVGTRVTAKFFDEEIGKEVEENGTLVEWWVIQPKRVISASQALVELDNSNKIVLPLSKLSREV